MLRTDASESQPERLVAGGRCSWADGPTSVQVTSKLCQSPMSPDLGHTFLLLGTVHLHGVLSSQKRNHFLPIALWRVKVWCTADNSRQPLTPQYYKTLYKTRT